MKIRTIKLFGREILRIESWDEATVSDVVHAMVANRLIEVELVEESEEGEDLIECEGCGTMYESVEEDEIDEEVQARFADLTENLDWGSRIVWDATSPEDEDEA